MSRTRIAFVGDIHHGADTQTKRGTAALPLLRRFVERVNDGGFDAVVDLGDRISDVSPERDRLLQAEVAAEFRRLNTPRHHVSGNHDLALLSRDENEAILGAPTRSRAVELDSIRLALWQPDVALTPARGFHLGPGDLEGLVGLLDSDQPTILVSHVPLSGHAQTGNYYFEKNPGHATYAEIAEIRRVIAAAPCPVAAFAGHVHWNTFTVVDGTPQLTLQSLTETFAAGGEPSGCTGVLDIDGESLAWKVGGRERFGLELDFPSRRWRWVPPLPRFDARQLSWAARAEPAQAPDVPASTRRD